MTAVIRGSGTTPSERYLAKLADKTFLNLWSYPNLFIDKKKGGKGDGKELCDLLVVCGEDIFIFSDKSIEWPKDTELPLAWTRWYRKAIEKSVAQVRGAERWLTQFPDRIFLDAKCTQRLPLDLPSSEIRRVHGIIVALGAHDACAKHFELILPFTDKASKEQVIELLNASTDNKQICHASLCATKYLPPLFASHGKFMGPEKRKELADVLKQYEKVKTK